MLTSENSVKLRSKHINTKYFYLREKHNSHNGEVQIVHVPTGEMIADALTKPLQGKEFYRLRDLLLNHQV